MVVIIIRKPDFPDSTALEIDEHAYPIILTNVEIIADLTPKMPGDAPPQSPECSAPEGYVMAILNLNTGYAVRGNRFAARFSELKSLDLPEERTAEFSATLCGFMNTHFGIPSRSGYIEFASPRAGRSGGTAGPFSADTAIVFCYSTISQEEVLVSAASSICSISRLETLAAAVHRAPAYPRPAAA